MKQGFLSTILNGIAVGTKVSVCYRQSGHESGVVVKRGSTVLLHALYTHTAYLIVYYT